MKRTGFYIVKDKFFEDMNEPYLKGNKKESRPHYYCFEDSRTGICWMIPMSRQVEKYKKIINKRLDTKKTCDILYITKLDDGGESVFLIQDMFPITEEYIEREYTIAGKHMLLSSEQRVHELERKAKKVLKKLQHGVKFTPTQPDIMKIMNRLNRKKEE